MDAVIIGRDAIDRPRAIILIDLKLAVDDGNIPSAQIDKDPLSISVHAVENGVGAGLLGAFDYTDHR
jgi:hypothetical protein